MSGGGAAKNETALENGDTAADATPGEEEKVRQVIEVSALLKSCNCNANVIIISLKKTCWNIFEKKTYISHILKKFRKLLKKLIRIQAYMNHFFFKFQKLLKTLIRVQDVYKSFFENI